MWGFTVDDALIICRVAANIAGGLGYRFNKGGPVVDAVTPLGFAYLLAPAASHGPLAALRFAKWLGAASWVIAAGWLGVLVSRGSRPLRWSVLLPLAVCAPVSAWAASGMETGVVLALATLSLSDSRAALLAAGIGAALRPELLPWSATLALGRSVASHDSLRRTLSGLALATLPAVAVVLIRSSCFGSPVPLAVWAKPSDLDHGVFYALGAAFWTGIPILVAAPRSILRLGGKERAVLVATLVHVLTLVVVGGDWMPLFRLFTPVLPGLLWVGASLCHVASPWATAIRTGLATVVCGALLFDKGPALRGVMAQRATLVARARPVLSGARCVAALDVGWIGAATDARVLDLAGVTDPEIARLPGGHTSKHLPAHLLERRGVDWLVLLVEGRPASPWTNSVWERLVETRISKEAAMLGFHLQATLEVPGTPWSYAVLRLKNGP